jgi:hypothetical protein
MKKGIAVPVLITVCIVLFCAFFAVGVLIADYLELWMRILGLVVVLTPAGIGVYVLAERIKEIQSGEEDDLGKY